jgi:hypothetical protein
MVTIVIDIETLPPSALLNEKQVAEVLGVPPGTLNMWRCQRRVPLPWIKLGKQVRYRVSDIKTFLEDNRQSAFAA